MPTDQPVGTLALFAAVRCGRCGLTQTVDGGSRSRAVAAAYGRGWHLSRRHGGWTCADCWLGRKGEGGADA